MVIKGIWYLHKTRYVDQMNKIEDPDMSIQNLSHLVIDKDAPKQWLE